MLLLFPCERPVRFFVFIDQSSKPLNRCESSVVDEEYDLGFTIHRCVITAVHSMLFKSCGEKATGYTTQVEFEPMTPFILEQVSDHFATELAQ